MSIALAEEAVAQVAEKAAAGRMILGIGENLLDAVLGYAVVFIGLALLMLVVICVGKVMVTSTKKSAAQPAVKTASAPETAAVPAAAVKKELAPGSAGEVKIYDTDPRDAAMIMAIVADTLQKPLNELRFVSIKEVKE